MNAKLSAVVSLSCHNLQEFIREKCKELGAGIAQQVFREEIMGKTRIKRTGLEYGSQV